VKCGPARFFCYACNRIELRNFRNYERLKLDVERGINVFFGDNGQGKTNLLEAVYLCACARSHRTPRDVDLIRKGADGYTPVSGFWIPAGMRRH
jgi:recombinational DNA repair ATPase RecF